MILLLSYDVRRRGGIERLSLQVRRCLRQQNQVVRLLCPQQIEAGPFRRQLGTLWFLLQLGWWLPQASQVLSMHALLLRPIRWLRPLRRRDQPLHCWLHGIEVWGAALAGVQADLQRCQGLIASSHFTRDRLLEAPGAWPAIAVVHPMADLIDATQPPEPLPPELRLLTVARLDATERYKGHRLVLQALHQMLHAGTLPANWQWRVVGDGDDRPALVAVSERLGLAPWVQFLGGLNDADLRSELRSCSLLLMPSSYGIETDGRACGEGFGIVYLEAAQAGRASIACHQGGQTDLIVNGHTGWLINPAPEALANLLRALATDPEQLSVAGTNARAHALDNFGYHNFRGNLLRSLGLDLERDEGFATTR